MLEIKFTLHGNQLDNKGNPKPKARFTRAQHLAGYADDYREYIEWVKGKFFDATHTNGRVRKDLKEFIDDFGTKPLITGYRKCEMQLFITWGKGHHGDPENIFGSIADAIFKQDKFLAGRFDFDPIERDRGSVDVSIIIGAEECGCARSSLHPRKRVKVEE